MVSKLPVLLVLILIELNGLHTNRPETERGLLEFFLSPCKCKCGVPNRRARFLGGEFVDVSEFPWLALVQIKQTRAASGIIINNKYVLSAATQLIGLTPFDIKVTVGLYDRCLPEVSSTNISVDKIIFHPDFDPKTRAHDLALIKLNSPILFDKKISPICLAVPNNKYLGQVATITSWQENQPPDAPSTIGCRPRKMGLPVLQYTHCLQSVPNPEFIGPDKGCAGIIGAPNLVCNGDAGSPVMYRSHAGVYELIGIVTDVNECGTAPSTAVYTRIDNHLGWITRNTKDACYCIKS